MNVKEIVKVTADALAIIEDDPFIALTARGLSFILDLTRNEEEALDKLVKYRIGIIKEKTLKEKDSLRNDWHEET